MEFRLVHLRPRKVRTELFDHRRRSRHARGSFRNVSPLPLKKSRAKPPRTCQFHELQRVRTNTMGEVTRRVRRAYKRKWFQVTRFAALLTTGMHGIEHRNQERRAFSLLAPQAAFSPLP